MRVVLSFICAALVLSTVWCESPDANGTYHGDFVRFEQPPDRVMDKCNVQVQYNCSAACRIRVEIVISTPTRTGVIVYRRTWTNHKRFGKPRSRTVPLVFPPAVLYRRDFFVRRPVETCDVLLRAWMVNLVEEEIGGNHAKGYDQTLVRNSTSLRTLPLSERPAYPQTRSVSWGAWLMWQLTKDTVRKCPHESDIVDILTFPFASTGERFGIIHTFSSFKNKDLERRRTLDLKQPSVTLSVWLYLLSWCGQSVCGIIKHVNEHRSYGSPLIMLSDTGNIVVQVQMVNGEERAFTAHAALPLHTWIRLDIFFQVSEARLKITKILPGEKTVETTHFYDFHQSVQFNETSGYFVIGGCSYMPGFSGYVGPIRYYRLGTENVTNPLSPVRTLKELDRLHKHCEEIRQVTEQYLQALRQNRDISRDVCECYYGGLKRKFGHRECTQSWSWDQQRRFNLTLKLLEENQELITGLGNISRHLLHLGRMIFQDVVKTISKAEETDGSLDLMSTVIKQLEVSFCWGHQHSSLLLATLYLAGLGIPVDLEQGHVYSLIGGVFDDRLSLMHLGYKHMQGLDGFPKNQNTAYGYYANIGKQTSIDRSKVQDSWQTLIEHVHLNNNDELHTQTGELGDVVQYLKHQADRGDIESQKNLARMHLWGSNGVEKDIRAAVMWYARSALQMVDPIAMYDYAILLLKGTGVKKNRTLGLELLEKAADMGSVEALNGLGWYYSTIVKDGRKAFRYFELAAQNGSRDGLFNVGVYHLNGENPYQPERNETAAFHYFLEAAHLGHVEGAVHSALFLSTGAVQGVPRDQGKAVLLLKQASEINGHLGFMVKDALQTYQRGSWDEALVKYATLAETGLGVAQHNAAHLCEVLGHSSACQWRYHNYSTYNHIPQEAGLLHMGDYYSDLGDMVNAIEMYTTAAVYGSAQGLFNLAMLIKEGHNVPDIILDQMGLSAAHDVSRNAVVANLLSRCREFEEGDVTPCSLVLWGMELTQAWRDFTHSSVQLPLACGIAFAFTVFVFAVMLRTLLACYTALCLSTSQSSERHGEPELNRQESSDSLLATRTESQQQSYQPTIAHNHLSVQETSDLIVTVTGVCVCVIFTMFISHLL
ncbi:protein sel-1 homolog 3 isoform X2 [Labeo rohita]|uniref:protein sel-1 homolog 3 isoform X2 n=1 Tax=Labeo rohita TaxID=84645 RepID=UPI0021E289F8|nr:protein sel-1 homolog 3 isoform X2 [Labeo rohita]